MREINYPRFKITVFTEKLDNGLTVFLIPKPGFKQVFSMFTTKYGSIDSHFKLKSDERFTHVPDGIAHFLEHKMFEEEDGDVFTEFATHGASANAFTSFDQTSYLFSATEDIVENTNTLLDFVQRPYFTDENVEKEKGIIGQEIRMYDDNPDWRAFFGLLRALFVEHPVRIDIAGTIDSIAKIDKAMLYQCHQTFYHPGNMVYCAVGGFNPDVVMATIRENQCKKSYPPSPEVVRKYPLEPAGVREPRTVAYLSVIEPRCLIGWKEQQVGQSGRALLEHEMCTGVVMDALFGKSSTLYDTLIEEGLVDQGFSWEYEVTEEYGYSVVGSNSPNPEKLVQRIEEAVHHLIDTGLDVVDFERSRKKAIGRFMTTLDQPSTIVRGFTSYLLRGIDVFETVEVLEQLTIDRANKRLRNHFIPAQQSVSLVYPKESMNG